MPNPLVFSAGTTTINSSHSLKCTKLTVIANSATAVTAVMNDVNGNVMGVPVIAPSGAGNEVTADFVVPVIVPGGTNAVAIPGTAITPSVNAVITVTGGGGVAYLYHR